MPFILKKYYPARYLVFFMGEGILIFIILSGVSFLVEGPASWAASMPLHLVQAGLVTLIFQFSLYFFDLYDLNIPSPVADLVTRIVQAFGIGCILLAGLYFTFPPITISSKVFWTGYLMICASVAGWRFFYLTVLDRQLFAIPVLLLGSGIIADKIIAEIRNKRDSGYRIAAQLDEGGEGTAAAHPLYSRAGDLLQICRSHQISKIVVTLDDKRGKTPIKELLACKLQNVEIVTGIRFFEGLTGKIMVEKVNPSWIIYSEGFRKTQWIYFVKRGTDMAASFLGLLLSLPVLLVTAIIIKLDSPGPVFYLQERVGEKGRIFKVVKFRSMQADAEKDGPVWAGQNDSRVTRFGGFIRKVRIDEIPQMWNVLKGEMSFVGPRPERPVFVNQLEKKIPYYSLRHHVRPGITGWAQVCYPYGASEEDALRKLEYDLYYLKYMSFGMDLWIIFLTAKTVLFQKGAR